MKNWSKFSPKLKKEFICWFSIAIMNILVSLGFLVWIFLNHKTLNSKDALIGYWIFGGILLSLLIIVLWSRRLDKLEEEEINQKKDFN